MEWTVDTGAGPQPCTVPHCWGQDVDVRWEGPAVYRTTIQVERTSWLVFHGVSYEAKVFLDDELATVHEGIWDAFSVPVTAQGPRKVDVRVEVTKNGGPRFPVKDVLSGFLPYVFNSFGGMFREVELVTRQPILDFGGASPRVSVQGTKVSLDGQPWFMRGVLSWGWYPEIGSPHPPIEVVREEVRKVKALGFNLVKFCLWLPPHAYFQVLEEEELWAWVELPLWLPSETMGLEAALAECERIVRQYRHHDRIIAWTCGCELSHSTPHGFRQRLYQMVKDLTGCPLVKDNSGGAEMYGGDLREYGDFYDFHPYCDTMFYPSVLESLRNGPRKAMPILLGEYNDYDVYRPLHEIREANPYWTSADPHLNDQGVRWQHDVPTVLASSAIGLPREVEDLLHQESRSKSGWIREFVTKTVVQHDDVAGYVVTGLADTPISTSGVLSDPHVSGGVFDDLTFFRVPHRQPPWINGGNRPAWADCHNLFPGANTVRLGARSTHGLAQEVSLSWAEGEEVRIMADLAPNVPAELATLSLDIQVGRQQTLCVGTEGHVGSYFDFACYGRFDWADHPDWFVLDPSGRLGMTPDPDSQWHLVSDLDEAPDQGVLILDNSNTMSAPFWRECVTWNQSGCERLDSWDFLYPVSTDRVIDTVWLEESLPGAEWLLTRVDTRTYQRHPYLVRKGNTVVTTLRPWGGLGAQPSGLANSPAGCELLRILMRMAQSSAT